MKDVVWVSFSLKDMQALPDDVRQALGYGLYLAQEGGKHPKAKPLRGFGTAGVLELVDDYDGATYRAVYTVTLPSAVYVLHVFQKKAKHGIATPKQNLDLFPTRLRDAQTLEQQRHQRSR